MPEVESVSWKDRIAAAKSTSFAALTPGRYTVEIVDASVAQGAKGEYINVKTKVAEGERTNARVNTRTFPNAKNVSMFLDFIKAFGLSTEWLMSEPTMEEVVSALVGRRASAEVYVESDAGEDNNGEKWRSLKGFKALSDVPASADTATAAPEANAGWGAAAKEAVAPTPVTAAAPASDPWGTPTAGGTPPANPFGQ